MLTRIVRHNLQQTAALAVQGANSLLDLSTSEGDPSDAIPMEGEALGEQPTSIGSTAMVTAAAAALALMKLRN